MSIPNQPDKQGAVNVESVKNVQVLLASLKQKQV
jgi:hypothetical protein